LSGNLTEEILSSLKESEFLLVIASRNSANSTWVQKEIFNWYKLNHDENGYITNLAFILVEGGIVWNYFNNEFDKLKSTALPSFEKKMFKELPLWADLQLNCLGGKIYSDNTSYAWEIAKIKGLLLGKRPDEILDEGSKKKNLFRIIICIIILFVLLLVGYLLYKQSTRFEELSAEREKNLYNSETVNDSLRHEVWQYRHEYDQLEVKIDSIIKLQNHKINYETKLRKQLNNSKEYFKNYITEYNQFKKEQLNYSNKLIHSSTLYFDLDKYNIRQEEALDLGKVLDFLYQFPNSIIFIEAYQTNDESVKSYVGYDYGLRLSKKRAESTKEWLVINGIDSNKIKVNGTIQYLKSRAIETEVQKQLYRKADIFIYDIKN
jgi:outer membrane protein OmpA-like peptidoglycan-associated protein